MLLIVMMEKKKKKKTQRITHIYINIYMYCMGVWLFVDAAQLKASFWLKH